MPVSISTDTPAPPAPPSGPDPAPPTAPAPPPPDPVSSFGDRPPLFPCGGDVGGLLPGCPGLLL